VDDHDGVRRGPRRHHPSDQGDAMTDPAIRLEDGGGRELAYVSMSRARERSTVYAIADGVDQAVDDLKRDWPQQRRQRWAIDSGMPAVLSIPEVAAEPLTDPLSDESSGAGPFGRRVPGSMSTPLRYVRGRSSHQPSWPSVGPGLRGHVGLPSRARGARCGGIRCPRRGEPEARERRRSAPSAAVGSAPGLTA